MFSLDEGAIDKLAGKVKRYDISVHGSIKKPKDEEGNVQNIPTPTFDKFEDRGPQKISRNAVRGIVLSMRNILKTPLATDGVSILFALSDLERIVPDAVVTEPAAPVVVDPNNNNQPVEQVTAQLQQATIEEAESSSKKKKKKGKQPAKAEVPPSTATPKPTPTPTPTPTPAPTPAPTTTPLLYTGKVINLVIERKDTFYFVQLKAVNWNANDQLERSQMLQVAVQYSFFVDAVDKSKSIVLAGRNIFMGDRKQPFSDTSDLMLFTGIFQSFRFNGYAKPMVNIDLSHLAALRSDISVYDFIDMAANSKRMKLQEALKNPRFIDYLNNALAGKLVKARYGSNITYRLDKIDNKNTADTAKFEVQEKKQKMLVSVAEYMQKKKQAIKNKNAPLLVARIPPKDKTKAKAAAAKDTTSRDTPTWLVAEFFTFALGEKRKADLTAMERSDMIRLTREEPKDRLDKIQQNVNDINSNEYWKVFGVQILKNISAECKVLTPVELQYKGSSITPSDGTWNLEGFKLYEVPTAKVKWAMMYPRSRYDAVNEFVVNFVKMAKAAGYQIEDQPEYLELQYDDPNDYYNELKAAAPQGEKMGIKFYIIALPEKEKERYSAVKDVSCTELGIVTQCVVFEARPKGPPKTSNPSVLANIVAGINPKICFQNAIVSPEKIKAFLGGKVNPKEMVVFGLDVFHGRTDDPDNSPSVVAMCAATNEHFTKYATALRTQNARKEIVQDIAGMTREVMTEYMRQNRNPPKHVLFYRDGVGEGMYDTVEREEILALQQEMATIAFEHKAQPPKLTMLIVQKRNHLRTYAPDTSKGNPYPGTLVDNKELVDIGRPNFYLYSHKALAGTARPTHYQILRDEIGFTVHQLAEFTYALAHLHQGCTKAVSLPAPVFYADRAAGVAGTCYRSKVGSLHNNLKNTLFMI